ncbi:hypothetical protein K435DRAFT_843254 [Dendrothele bispora CBS 962.96]|uniref:Xylanolytic transcriptional activator regulatory domain-containing protein n=1 Tax=Dendrothele bispora (strain CBS 962.96) TaxID=1314807 RepID=A0A4S8L9J0_DENBC|nr:hypothetical protein K435DRAFT_843254 [Dendrothele bispora CBS 962.96]
MSQGVYLGLPSGRPWKVTFFAWVTETREHKREQLSWHIKSRDESGGFFQSVQTQNQEELQTLAFAISRTASLKFQEYKNPGPSSLKCRNLLQDVHPKALLVWFKCDGVRPICGPCNASGHNCRYSDGSPSEDQMLQEEIALLESRLEQLQNPAGSSRSMSLHSPYQASVKRESPPLQLSPDTQRNLFRSFMPYASDFGFLLDFNRLSNTVSANQGQIAPSLLSTIYLFGSYLSPSNEMSNMQPAFLSRAIHDAVQGFSLSDPQRVLHCIQAECLLAQYLFTQGRILEGKYRISTAVSIVLGSGFHKIRSAEQLHWSSHASTANLGVGVNALPPPRDYVEEGERINALWTVLILNHCWTAADGSPSNISYDVPESRIDAPWPLDTGSYAQTPLPDNVRGSSTIQNFLANNRDTGYSLLALHAKAAILFEQASLILRQYKPNMSLQDATRFQSKFTKIDNVIRRFKSELPPIPSAADIQQAQSPSDARSTARRLLIAHTLASVASIQLHYTFANKDPGSQSQILLAAQNVVNVTQAANLEDFPFIDPIMGTLWIATVKVFTDEITRRRSGSASRSSSRMSPQDLMTAVEAILSAMGIFAPRSSLMNAQLAQVRQVYATAMQ